MWATYVSTIIWCWRYAQTFTDFIFWSVPLDIAASKGVLSYKSFELRAAPFWIRISTISLFPIRINKFGVKKILAKLCKSENRYHISSSISYHWRLHNALGSSWHYPECWCLHRLSYSVPRFLQDLSRNAIGFIDCSNFGFKWIRNTRFSRKMHHCFAISLHALRKSFPKDFDFLITWNWNCLKYIEKTRDCSVIYVRWTNM